MENKSVSYEEYEDQTETRTSDLDQEEPTPELAIQEELYGVSKPVRRVVKARIIHGKG